MAEHWLVSDTHFGHENIIAYAGRPFTSAGQMDAYMVETWNARVRPQDHVYHLGDVTMERSSDKVEWFIGLIRSLHGHKRLILGNHDHMQIKTYTHAGFEKIRGTGAWLGDGLLLSHFPVHTSSIGMRSKACIHGHIHEKPAPRPAVRDTDGAHIPYINVCVEQTGYGPIHLDEVYALIRRAQCES